MAISTFTLSACESTPSEDPTTVIKKAWEKLADENQELSAGTANIRLEADGTLSFGSDTASVDLDLDMQVDSTKLNEPKLAMKADISGEGSFQGQSGKASLSGEVRSIDKVAYFFLENFSLDTGQAEVDLMANFAQNFFKSKWISVKEDALDTASLNPEEIDPEKMSQILKENQLIKFNEDLGGGKYNVKIDTEALKNFIVALNEEGGNMSAEELQALQTFNEDLTDAAMEEAGVSYEILVSINNDYEFTWIKIDFDVEDPDTNNTVEILVEANISGNNKNRKGDGSFSLTMTGDEPASIKMNFEASADDSSVSIEIPEGAEEFDPSSFLGLGGALGAPSGLEGLPPEAELGL